MRFCKVRTLLVLVALLALAEVEGADAKDVLPGPVQAELIAVKDGDTLRARATIWLGQAVEINVRIAGVDTPEIGGRARCDAERKLAIEARAFLVDFVGQGPVTLTNVQYGKYAGRVLANVANGDQEDAGTALIKGGFARLYRGGKRQGWC